MISTLRDMLTLSVVVLLLVFVAALTSQEPIGQATDFVQEDSNPQVGGNAVVDACSNAVWDGTESDIDCGGSCTKCNAAKICYVDSDCASALCNAGKCT